MFKALLVPPDAMLYETAKNYVACIVAQRRGCAVALSVELDAMRSRSHAEFEAALVRYGIEFDDKEDVLDIAVELNDYAERSEFR